MRMNSKNSIKVQMNRWAVDHTPFLFIIDFELKKPRIFKLEELDPEKLLYNLDGVTNFTGGIAPSKNLYLIKHPESYEEYLYKFNRVMGEIAMGNTYLLNLTCSTPIELNLTLKEVFLLSNARYKLWIDGEFVCFSPEIFVRIGNKTISSYPMKGTIDASIPGAQRIILEDKKETAEHYTIVDLIRNDLNRVSKRVRVERFRYIDAIVAHDKQLLQVSSEICGDLDDDYLSHIGDIIFAMLPAGSVSGAPKKKTVEVIADVEKRDRGYYTGIFGIFDGYNLNSSVMIRFIENIGDMYIYRSGGGITSFSDPLLEYNEMIDKIYLPVV